MKARIAEAARKTIAEVLARRSYSSCQNSKGTLRLYLMWVTRYGRAQITGLSVERDETRGLKASNRVTPGFPKRYAPSDLGLLANVDATHQRLPGTAVHRFLNVGWRYAEVRLMSACQYLGLPYLQPYGAPASTASNGQCTS